MIVVAAVIARNGRVLACQRNGAGRFPLKWEFPGGKVLADETAQEALARELNEELGVEATIGAEIFRTRHKYDEMREAVELIFFKARIVSGEIENRIFQEMKWVEPQKLSELDFLEADRELIRKLGTQEIPV
ncbi:MAG TPA: (deoxy)nucleoside triphosphate pyrophosphohydrolase [Candidatus Acidoferrales bacterium]|nr:(deoxy)nucleoside triphosphate pyrophosphohydrolase [Candidatus Acidoferrales bacterium]